MTPDQLAKAHEYVLSDRHITREMAQRWLAEIERLRALVAELQAKAEVKP